MDNRRHLETRELIRNGEKLHRNKEHLHFLTKCHEAKTPPPYTSVPKQLLRTTNWSRDQLLSHRLKIIDKDIQATQDRICRLQTTFNISLSKLQQSISSSDFLICKKHIFSKIATNQAPIDKKRNQKLKTLLSSSKQHKSPITIFNSTNVTIPQDLLNLLEYGIDLPIGGSPNDYKILTSLEKLTKNWTAYAEENNIDPFTIDEAKSYLKVNFHLLRKCYNPQNRQKLLTTFLDQNPEVRFIKIDKSKNLELISHKDYSLKLNKQFNNAHFEKLPRNPLTLDIKYFYTFLRKMEPYISKSTWHQITPNYALKAAYGIIKRHKPNHPLRPIVSSKNSITSGIESYFVKILNKLLPKIKYSFKSTQDFKKKFLIHRAKFNPKTDWIISFDVESMYPSIPLDRIIPKIVDIIYSDPKNFFESETRDDVECEIMPRTIFEEIFTKTLRHFTAFSTESSFFRQKQGVAMGSQMSGIIANITMSFLEQDIIDNEIVNKNLKFYGRYVDDIICIIKKSEVPRINHLINNWDKNINFTIEFAQNHSLTYLDTRIYFDQNTKFLELKQFQKPSKTDTLQNFEEAVSPLSQKIGLLSGEIYRANNTTTTPENLDHALKSLVKKFTANSYPVKLVKSKIKNIQDANFIPPEKDPNITHRFHLSLEYTSPRVNKIAKTIANMIRKITPSYKVVLAFKTLRLGQIITSRLKRKIEYNEKSGICYKFLCSCNKSYIGETLRTFHLRRLEHTRLKSNTAIKRHFSNCPIFQNEYENHINSPEVTSEISEGNFAKTKFSILQSNLSQYTNRTLTESFLITLFKPTINEQTDYRKEICFL